MTKVTKRTLIVGAMVAASSLTAIPTSWAGNTILVDNNPRTANPTSKSDQVTASNDPNKWAIFEGAVGSIPTGGGARGAWANTIVVSSFNQQHRLTLVWQCNNGSFQQQGPILFTGAFLNPDLTGTCSGASSSTPINAIITDNLAN